MILHPEQIVLHLRAEDLQRRLVFAEAGAEEQGLPGPQSHAAGENQLRRAVAAEDGLSVHPFKLGNGADKPPAIGVRVAPEPVYAPRHRVLHRLGGAIGVDIGGKIQVDFPGVQVPAVGILGFV